VHVIISTITASLNLSGSAETTHTITFLIISTSLIEVGGAVAVPSAFAACLSIEIVILQSPTLTATEEG